VENSLFDWFKVQIDSNDNEIESPPPLSKFISLLKSHRKDVEKRPDESERFSKLPNPGLKRNFYDIFNAEKNNVNPRFR